MIVRMVGGVPKTQRRKELRGESPTPSEEQPRFVATVNSDRNGKKSAATGS
ncbi:MAG: hypothetical protein RM347_020115 [Nostoc sp. ChiQUE02]|uniref:hypothetical protein n=1 Tax=Nostoc sp. ChiQUE02 TaxID=3075377 RepID=UPI002AD46E99|nr:hypothetical protein [Nostoc sp. ChiQUE02]MDZ8229828.1 hypothetical protein [Nostoc sp. ChiQUE02]